MHEAGLVHRDIKPGNIMVTDAGEAILLDLGLVREVSAGTNSDRTERGAIVGTPQYMAPEQARNSRGVNSLADICSLGLVFRYLLAGEDPFPGRSLYEVLTAQQTKAPTPVATCHDDVPSPVLSVLERMTRKEPHDRFPAPVEVAKELQQTLATENLPPPREGTITDPTERQRHLDRGLLNDVGTCLWVQARCLARLGRLDEARKVHEDASKLSFAICWDRGQDLFWSPAKKARDDLEILDQLPLK